MNHKKREKKKVRVWYIVLGIGAVLVGVIGIGLIATEPGLAEVAHLTFSDIDFGRLRNGTYIGNYNGVKDSIRDTSVKVIISSGKVVEIHAIGGGLADGKQADELSNGKSLDDLFNSVMERETLRVDAISGATLTSKSYLKAVEDALNKAQQD